MDNSIEERFQLAISYRDKDKWGDAIAELQDIIKVYPNHNKLKVVFISLAGIYYDQADYQKSVEYFKKATYLDPTSELASLGLYLSYLDLGKSEDAIAELKRYLQKCPAKRYITTLEELLVDLKNGYATNYESIILELAKKNNVFLKDL